MGGKKGATCGRMMEREGVCITISSSFHRGGNLDLKVVICPCFPSLCGFMGGGVCRIVLLRVPQGCNRRQVLALARRELQAPPQVLQVRLMAISLNIV